MSKQERGEKCVLCLLHKMLGSVSLARACTNSAGASKERERNSFFDSLRRKSRSPSLAPLGEGEDTPAGAAAPTEEAADAATPNTAQRGTRACFTCHTCQPCTACITAERSHT